MTKMDKKSRHAEIEMDRIGRCAETENNKIGRCKEVEMDKVGRCAGVSPLSQSDPSPVLKYPRHPKNEPKRKQETDNTKPLTSLNCKLGAGLRLKNVFA